MKRHYRLEHPEGLHEVATITVEAEAVTVTRRVESTRSKGQPVRIPTKMCQGGSVELEARVQQLKLQAAGFTFVREEDADPNQGKSNFLYVVVRRTFIGEAIDYVTGAELPPGVQVGPYVNGQVVVSDVQGNSFRLDTARDFTAVLATDAPLSALAMLLLNRGIAELVHETDPTPAGSQFVGNRELFKLAQALPDDLRSFVAEAGITHPGTIVSVEVSAAVLL